MQIKQVLIFGIIGIWNTFFDLALFWLVLRILTKIGHKNPTKLSPIINIFSFCSANLVSYFLNTKFTFASSKSNRGFLPYFIITLISLAVSTFLIAIFTQEKYYKSFSKIFPKLNIDKQKFAVFVKLLTILISMVINFLGYKYFVF